MPKTKRTKVLVILMTMVLATSSFTAVFAATGAKTLQAFYNDIKIYVDGAAVNIIGENGDSMEPFIVDGRTYLPINAVSRALGKNIGWDGQTYSVYIGANPQNMAELYKASVEDSMVITDDEIFPLTPISADSELCTWDEDGCVLMITHHSYPDSYVAGEDYTLKYGEVWTFTEKEMIEWYKENKDGVTDWDLRFKQLIGLPADHTYTHFSAMWVKPEDMTRPGYAWKLSDTVGKTSFADEPVETYKVWFDSNILWSYYDSAYPWTRLGYTYDWAANCDEYGLSEFIVRKDAVTKVAFTRSTEEFVAWLEAQ